MSHLKKTGIGVIFFFVQIGLYAQVQLQLSVNQPSIATKQYVIVADSFPLLRAHLTKQIDSCKNQGFLFAYSDTILQTDSNCFVASLYTGICYQTVLLSAGNLPTYLQEELGQTVYQKAVPIPFIKWRNLLNKLVQKAQEQGYPFAQVFLDSVLLDSNQVKAAIQYNSGPLMLFDSISLGGTVQLQAQYLIHLSGIHPGMPYHHSLLTKFDSKLNGLAFAKLTKPTAVYFYGNKAKPYLSLSPILSNVFDGIIGFAPQSSLNQSLVLTGDLKLKLCNLWGTGLQIETAYKSYLIGSKELQFSTEIPYIRNFKLGFSYAFRMLKFDSLYLELNHDFSYKVLENEYLSMRIVYKYKSFNLLYTDTAWVRLTQKIPNLHDAISNQFGVQFSVNKLNDVHFPTKGVSMQLNSSIVQRRLVQNALLENVLFLDNNQQWYTVYSKQQLYSIQWQLVADFKSYIPISKSLNVLGQLSGALLNGSNLLQQEQFRIGGLKTLKGFDEQSLFANQYISGNIECRYLLPQNSSFILFYNQAWMNNQLISNNTYSQAQGFGAGMYINTSNGLLSVFYAVGKINSAEFNFNAAKIHFGYNHLF